MSIKIWNLFSISPNTKFLRGCLSYFFLLLSEWVPSWLFSLLLPIFNLYFWREHHIHHGTEKASIITLDKILDQFVFVFSYKLFLYLPLILCEMRSPSPNYPNDTPLVFRIVLLERENWKTRRGWIMHDFPRLFAYLRGPLAVETRRKTKSNPEQWKALYPFYCIHNDC